MGSDCACVCMLILCVEGCVRVFTACYFEIQLCRFPSKVETACVPLACVVGGEHHRRCVADHVGLFFFVLFFCWRVNTTTMDSPRFVPVRFGALCLLCALCAATSIVFHDGPRLHRRW